MKVLFADAIDPSGPDRLRDLGHEVVVCPSVTADELPSQIGDAEVLIVRSTKVTADTIAAGSSLSMIVRAGAGVDNVDCEAASNHGIYVCNVPGRNAMAVAELTMGLILALDRRIPDNVADLRAGQWNKGRYSQADGLMGRRIAIIGLGEIGMAVARRAVGFGMDVITPSRPSRTMAVRSQIDSLGIESIDSMEEMLGQADIVSIHVPKRPDTIGMVDAEFLAMMKPGAMLINTSRGDVVNHQALLTALEQGRVRAGLDVWPNEPGTKEGPFDSALARHPNVVGTHHIGASTNQAQQAIAEGTMEVIEAFLDGAILNCVNLDHDAVGTSCVVIRHVDQVGVLAKVFSVLKAGGHNVQQMSNQVFSGGQAAVATIHLNGRAQVNPSLVNELESIDEVLAVTLIG